MPKLIWEKKLQEALKLQQRFGWSVRNMRGKVFLQRYYQDINKKVTATLPIMWEPNQELNVLNALQKINEVMQNSGCSLKEAVEIIYGNNNYKININWNKLVEDFKKYKNISKSSWEGNYSYFLKDIVAMMGSSNEPKTKPYAKREVIQLIHQIIKDNVLERNQNRKIEEIKDALVSRENSNGNNLINITEI